jgi:hypothetical protein
MIASEWLRVRCQARPICQIGSGAVAAMWRRSRWPTVSRLGSGRLGGGSAWRAVRITRQRRRNFYYRCEGNWKVADNAYRRVRDVISEALEARDTDEDREGMVSIHANEAYSVTEQIFHGKRSWTWLGVI